MPEPLHNALTDRSSYETAIDDADDVAAPGRIRPLRAACRRLSAWRRRCGATAGGSRRGRGPQPVTRGYRSGCTISPRRTRTSRMAVRVVEGQERQESADDRDAARDRRNAHDDDAAERDRPGGGGRLHPARADGIQPARLVRRSGAAGTPRRAACAEPGARRQRRPRRRPTKRRQSRRRHPPRLRPPRRGDVERSHRSAEQPERSAQPARTE